MKEYKFNAKILPSDKRGGAYIIFPYDLKKEFGMGRVKVNVYFDDIYYRGSIVNMGVKDESGNTCYIIGILKSIRSKLNKDIGDVVDVKVTKLLEEEKIKEVKPKRHKIYDMAFSSVYPFYIEKVTKKGRKKEEVDEAIFWLTGYDKKMIQKAINDELTFDEFFSQAPVINKNANLIRGSICGVKIEDIQDKLMKNIRYLDKLIDEIAKGKPMEKVLRK